MAGIMLIGSPWLLGFHRDRQALWTIIVAGILVLLLAMVTDYEGGLFKKVLMVLHLALDRLIGSILGASPWLWGFEERIIWPHLSMGLLLLLVGLTTEGKHPYRKNMLTTKPIQ
jgi:hypothetical protein